MKTELKPCPFCGATGDDWDVRFSSRDHYAFLSQRKYEEICVVCDKCGAKSDYFLTEEEAAEAWNRRVNDADD